MKLATAKGERNCQAETPVDRVTTSSFFRLRPISVAIEAKRMMNGNVVSMMLGMRRNER